MKPSATAVLELLKQRGSFGATDRDCLLYAHTSRAAARVWELRQAGYEVTRTYETKYGVRFARYRLNERPVVHRQYCRRSLAFPGLLEIDMDAAGPLPLMFRGRGEFMSTLHFLPVHRPTSRDLMRLINPST